MTGVALAASLGQLNRPLLPLAVTAGGLAFAIPVKRWQTLAVVFAAVFDTVAAVVLGVVAGSWALGGLIVFVAAATTAAGRSRAETRRIALLAGAAVIGLVVLEHRAGIPALPTMDRPAGTLIAAIAGVAVTVTGLEVIGRLTGSYTAAALAADESTRRWWTFVDAATNAIVVEQQGRIVRVNRSAEILLERPSSELVGSTISSWLEPVPGSTETWTTPAARTTEVELVRTPLVLSGGPATLIVFKDVSDQRESQRRLERRVLDKDQFVASVSHEMRTPLTAVVGMSAMLDDDWDDLGESDRRELAGLIFRQSREVAHIVDDLLVVTRGDSERVDIQPERISLETEVLVAGASVDLRSKSMEIVGDGHAFADPRRVRQIVRNLLSNAVRYGGDRIVVHLRQLDTGAVVEVTDDGGPIDAEARDRIFEPYGRATRRGPFEPASIGLGLTVSRQLAAAMNGSLTYDHDGTWSRFRLEIPSPPVDEPSPSLVT